MEPITLTSKGRNLSATVFTPKKPNGSAVLVVHGFQSSQDGYIKRAQAAVDQGAICLTFDLSGHGKSDGSIPELSIQDHLDDVHAAYDFLAQQPGIDAARINGLGASYGGYLLTLLTRDRALSRLLLRVPAIYPDELITAPHKEFKNTDVRAFRLSITPTTPNLALGSTRNFTGHIHIVESEHDEQVPHPVMVAYAGVAQDCTLTVLEGAGHTLNTPELNKHFEVLISNWAKTL